MYVCVHAHMSAHVHVCEGVCACVCVYIYFLHGLLFHSYRLTHPFTVASGEMPFQTALIHCPSSASVDLVMFRAGISGQFPDSSHSPYKLLCCVVL
jgi:hypothetical protein